MLSTLRKRNFIKSSHNLSSFQYSSASTLTRETRYNPSPNPFHLSNISHQKKKHDVIIIGAGHNGLTAASYLSKCGMDVLVLERRDIIGGAAVTEEIFDGFKFSRASYLAGLLRPKILSELQLKEKYGLEFIVRNPSSFTPTKLNDPLYGGKNLMFWSDKELTNESIGQFSQNDIFAMDEYEQYLSNIRELIQPFLDNECPDFAELDFSSLLKMATSFTKSKNLKSPLFEIMGNIKSSQSIIDFVELMSSPISKILNRYFESEILKTTLATDAVIGSTLSPNDTGSAYVLLHHVMGESEALEQCAKEYGTEIITNAEVDRIMFDGNKNKVNGVMMSDGTVFESDYVLSNVTPYHTFCELFDAENNPFSQSFIQSMRTSDYQCGAFKINAVVNKLPNFECLPNEFDENGIAKIGPQHRGTVHFESRMEELEIASFESKQGMPATRPVIEMTIPSSLDESIVTNEALRDKGYHIVQLFVQHAPYDLNYEMCGVRDWDDKNGDFKKEFVEKRVFGCIDEFVPDFSSSVVNYDALSPRDLETIFGLYKGNIFHGAISLDQIGWNRPIKDMMGSYKTPLKGLYMCGSGAHPGGGVMGAPGRNCANLLKRELKLK